MPMAPLGSLKVNGSEFIAPKVGAKAGSGIFSWFEERWKDLTGVSALETQIALLTGKIRAQDDILYQMDKEKLILAIDKIDLQKKNSELQADVVNLNGAVESLKTELAANGVDLPAAKPAFIGTGYCYRPSVMVEEETLSMSNPCDMYVRSDLLCRKLNLDAIKKLPKYQKLMKIWEYVVLNFSYRYDKRENWQFHPLTLLRGAGDCEDSTIVFLDACRSAGVSGANVFNVVGNTAFGYHSYPVVWLSSQDIAGTPCENTGEGFYIFETTLDFVPAAPKKLNGSKYWAEGGLQNWLFYGSVKQEHSGLFNGITMPQTASSASDKRKRPVIDNSKKKKKEINNYWKEEAP